MEDNFRENLSYGQEGEDFIYNKLKTFVNEVRYSTREEQFKGFDLVVDLGDGINTRIEVKRRSLRDFPELEDFIFEVEIDEYGKPKFQANGFLSLKAKQADSFAFWFDRLGDYSFCSRLIAHIYYLAYKPKLAKKVTKKGKLQHYYFYANYETIKWMSESLYSALVEVSERKIAKFKLVLNDTLAKQSVNIQVPFGTGNYQLVFLPPHFKKDKIEKQD